MAKEKTVTAYVAVKSVNVHEGARTRSAGRSFLVLPDLDGKGSVSVALDARTARYLWSRVRTILAMARTAPEAFMELGGYDPQFQGTVEVEVPMRAAKRLVSACRQARENGLTMRPVGFRIGRNGWPVHLVLRDKKANILGFFPLHGEEVESLADIVAALDPDTDPRNARTIEQARRWQKAREANIVPESAAKAVSGGVSVGDALAAAGVTSETVSKPQAKAEGEGDDTLPF